MSKTLPLIYPFWCYGIARLLPVSAVVSNANLSILVLVSWHAMSVSMVYSKNIKDFRGYIRLSST